MSASSSESAALLDVRFLRRLESLAIASRKLGSGSERGDRKSPHTGSGIAFSTHRAYAPGDDFRFVDWKVFARSERLYVKQYEEERDLSVHLLLDCSGSMAHDDGAKFHYARQLTAALGYIALAHLDRVSVQPYSTAPHKPLAPLRGHNRALVLLRYLASLSAQGGTDLPSAAQAVCAREPRGGLSFVVTDGLDHEGLLRGIDLLRYGRIEPLLLLLTSAHDAEPRERGEVTLVDSETGDERTLHIDERMIARYRAAYRGRHAERLLALAERRVHVIELDIAVPLERAVLDLLRRRGVVT